MTVTTDPFSLDAAALPTPIVAEVPRWLREAIAKLGRPEIDSKGSLRRWLWRDGEAGVVIDRQTHIWQVVAFTPKTSVTFRSIAEPDDIEIRMATSLAGLGDEWTEPTKGRAA